MFRSEFNGYDRDEVDEYINKLKAEIMEQKLSILESERKCLDAQKQKEEIESKEKNILKAIQVFEDARKVKDTITNLPEGVSPFVRKVSTYYAIQVGSYDSFDYAKAIASKLKAQGYDVWILQ